jgi:hypothetical protein
MAHPWGPPAIIAFNVPVYKMIGPFRLILILPIDLSVQPPLPPGRGGSFFADCVQMKLGEVIAVARVMRLPPLWI